MIDALRRVPALQCVSRVCDIGHHRNAVGPPGGLLRRTYAATTTKHNLWSQRHSVRSICWAVSKVGAPSPDAERNLKNPPRRPKRKMTRRSGNSTFNQSELVKHLVRRGAVESQQTAAVMEQVDRGCFVHNLEMPVRYSREQTYQDEPLPIGLGQTISAPSMHGMCLDLLAEQLNPGSSILDVGSGSGYLTACMALLVGPTGRVVGVEKHRALSERSVVNINAACPHLAVNQPNSAVSVINGNIYKEEVLEPEVKFDAIHVGAAAVEVPEQLVARLNPGGRMVLPVGEPGQVQVLAVVDRTLDDRVVRQDVIPVRYVPLTRPEEGA